MIKIKDFMVGLKNTGILLFVRTFSKDYLVDVSFVPKQIRGEEKIKEVVK